MNIDRRHLSNVPTGALCIDLPSIYDGSPKLDAAGKQVWVQHVEFVDKPTGDKFRDQVIEALRRQHPDAFNATVEGDISVGEVGDVLSMIYSQCVHHLERIVL